MSLSNSTKRQFLLAVQAMADSAVHFNSKFAISPINTEDDGTALLRLLDHLSILVEETGEYAKSLNKGKLNQAIYDLADVLYVTLVGLDLLGVDGTAMIRMVTMANDMKSLQTHEIGPSHKLVPKNTDITTKGSDVSL